MNIKDNMDIREFTITDISDFLSRILQTTYTRTTVFRGQSVDKPLLPKLIRYGRHNLADNEVVHSHKLIEYKMVEYNSLGII